MSGKLKEWEALRTVAILAALGLVFSLLSPYFLTVENIKNVIVASATIGILAVGAAFVLGAAGLDLSVGSVMALSGIAAASVLNVWGWPWGLGLAVCLAAGAFVGGVNGFLIGRAGVPPFIATLGMLSIARGGALILSDGRPVYGLPEPIVFIGQGAVFGVPMPVILFLGIAVAAHFLLRRTAFGRYALAIGDNEKAARNAGINIFREKMKLYIFSGLLAAVAGLLFMGRVNAADPSAGMMYELSAITAAILGGTHLFGGRASVAGAILGALIMGVLQNGLTLLAVPAYYQQLAIGAVLIAAVLPDRLSAGKGT